MKKKLILGIMLLTGLQSTHPGGVMDFMLTIPTMPTTLSYEDKLVLTGMGLTLLIVLKGKLTQKITDKQQGKYHSGSRKVNMDCKKFYDNTEKKLITLELERRAAIKVANEENES